MGAPRCKFTTSLVDFLTNPDTPGMSCHHGNETEDAEVNNNEKNDSVASLHAVDQPSDACLCQYSQYVGVSIVRALAKWDEYFEQKQEKTALTEILYISRFHSNFRSKPDTPPPKV